METRDAQIINKASLESDIFTRYSKKFIAILKELIIGTDAETLIKVFKYGINNIQDLKSHYYGTSEGEHRTQVVR